MTLKDLTFRGGKYGDIGTVNVKDIKADIIKTCKELGEIDVFVYLPIAEASVGKRLKYVTNDEREGRIVAIQEQINLSEVRCVLKLYPERKKQKALMEWAGIKEEELK